MRIKLKRRRSFKEKVFKWIIVLFIIIISICIIVKVLYNNINSNNIIYLVSDVFSSYDYNEIDSLKLLFNYSFGIDEFNEYTKVNEEVKEYNPVVYIYNSHPTEAYNSALLEEFSINYTVYTASFILSEYLSDLGIDSLVEEGSISDILNASGWGYGSSYKASRILLEESVSKYPSLSFFIDLHRDSASHDITTAEIDDVSYARVLFVVGEEHDNYEANLNLANTLNNLVKEVDDGLTRGVIGKSGSGVNGIYNQDYSENSILIEVGGQYNTISEVSNTLKVIAYVLYTYLGVGEN